MATSLPAEFTVRIWRGKDDGRFAAYAVPVHENQTVLDIITEVQRHQAWFSCTTGTGPVA